MTPQRKQAVIFFFAMIFISISILVWHFRINRGVLVVRGETPFTVSIGKFKKFLCVESPCSFSLLPKKYRLYASKEEYFDSEIPVAVKRFRSQEIIVSFVFQPKIQTLGEMKLPVKLAEVPAFFGSPFLPYAELDLVKIPRGARMIMFSKSGGEALVLLGKELYFYQHSEDSKEASLERLALPAYEAIAYGDQNGALFLLEKTSGAEKEQRLLRFNLSNPSRPEQEILTVFERPLKNAALFISSDDRFVIIREKLSGAKSNFYLLDVEKKIKQKLALPENVLELRFVAQEFLVFHTLENGIPMAKLFSLKDRKETPLDTLSTLAVSMGKKENEIIFVSQQDLMAETTSLEIPEILEMAKGETKWFFIEQNLQTGEMATLATFERGNEEEFGQLAEKIENGVLFFSTQKGGKNFHHKLVLEKN